MNNTSTTDSTLNKKWENIFTNHETITRLLESCGLYGYKVSRVDRTYTIDPDRNGVIVILKNKKTGRLQKATIDIRHGRPSWQQMMDLTFGIGEGSDIRIAVYDTPDGYYDNSYNGEGEYMAQSFISILKKSGLNADLVQMSIRLRDGLVPQIEFTRFSISREETLPSIGVPSRKEFEVAEFWLFYYEPYHPSEPPLVFQPSLWFGEIHSAWRGEVELSILWDERGMLLEGIFESPKELETLNWLWNNRRDKLLEMYQGCQVTIEDGPDGSQKLVLRISPVPFRDFVLADKEEKENLAETYVDVDVSFNLLLGELIYEMKQEEH